MINTLGLRLYQSATFMTWFNFLSKTLGFALLLPLIISSFSESDIVLWFVLTTMISIGLLFDLGFTPTFVRFVAYASSGASIKRMWDLSATDENESKVDENESKVLCNKNIILVVTIINYYYKKLSIISFILLLFAGSFFVVNPIQESTSVVEGWLCWGVVICSSSFLLYGNKYIALLQGVGYMAANQRVMAITSVCATFLASLALFFDASMFVVITVYQLINSFSVLLNRQLAAKFIKGLSRKKSLSYSIDSTSDDFINLKNSIFSSAWKSGIGILMSVGLIHISGVLAANSLSAKESAMYLFSLQLIRSVSSFAQAPFYTKIPNMAALFAENKMLLLKNIAFSAQLRVSILFTFFCLFLTIALPLIDKVFHLNIKIPSSDLWILLSIGFLMERVGAMHIQLYSLKNKIIWHYVNGLTGAFMIIFFLFIVKYKGVLAFPISLILSYALFYLPISTFYASKVVGKTYLFKHIFVMLLCTMLLCSSLLIVF